jgi:F0F1-type ATP synthase assembly protein I
MKGDHEGTQIISELLAGIVFYGGLGWLLDKWLGTSYLIAIGIVVGLVISLYIITKRHGAATPTEVAE